MPACTIAANDGGNYGTSGGSPIAVIEPTALEPMGPMGSYPEKDRGGT